MAYITFNESLMTAGKGIIMSLQTLFDSKAWSPGPEGWNNAVKRKTQYFDSMYTLNRISKQLIKEVQRVNGFLFSPSTLEQAMNKREQYMTGGYPSYGTKISKLQADSATNYMTKQNIITAGFKNAGHQTCIKKLPAGGNKVYLLAITFDSDEIDHVEAIVKGTGIDAGLQLKEIPFRYDVSEYKKD